MALRVAVLFVSALAMMACAPVAETAPEGPPAVDTLPVEPLPRGSQRRPAPAPAPAPTTPPRRPAIPPRPPADGLPFHPSTPDETADRCGASGQQHLVGRNWPQELPRNMTRVRVYAEGSPVTSDYHSDRVNIELERGSQRIRAIRCG